MYLELFGKYRRRVFSGKEEVNDDVKFEMELIKQEDLGIDYIINKVIKYKKDHESDRELIVSDITHMIDLSTEPRSKKELIKNFIRTYNMDRDIVREWKRFMEIKKKEEVVYQRRKTEC